MNYQWNEAKIKDIAKIGDGAHASIKRIENGVMYLSSKNFGIDHVNFEQSEYISLADYQKHFKENSKAITKPQENDVLLGIIGTLGAPYLVKQNDFFGLSSSVSIIRSNVEVIDPKYLYYWFKSPIFQQSVNQTKSGVAQSFLSLGMIGSLPCYYPNSLPIQKKIAAILSAYDDLIENNLKQIRLLEEMAQITYQEWFVRLKFPNHENTPIDEITGLPIGWKIAEIQNACDVSGGGTPSKEINEYWENGNITWFSPTDLSKAKSFCLLDSSQKTTENGLKNSSAKLMQPDSFMMTSRATIGLFGLIDKPFSTNQGFINVTPHKNHYKYFLFFNFKSRVTEFLSNASGSTFLEIPKSTFKKLSLIVPNDDLLYKFDSNISPIIQKIMNMEKQNQRLKEARDILLPRLMTGKITVE